MPSGFNVTRDPYCGQKDFDQFYFHVIFKDVVKKIGDGEEDYVLEKKAICDKVKISDQMALKKNAETISISCA